MESTLHTARYYRKETGGQIICELCPHRCRIKPGANGLCRVRGNRDGDLYALSYGRIAAAHMDPIEKKPLYHFMPGQDILSIGTAGCNLRCKFCQNWTLVEERIPAEFISPDEIVEQAVRYRSVGIAYTYNEPGIWIEYIMDCAERARRAGLKNVLVTNGFLNPAPWNDLCRAVDAMNIDLKSMDDEFYHRLCGGSLEPVLDNIRAATETCHVEVTNLIVTGENDSKPQINAVIEFVAGIRDTIPLHFSRYFPQNKMTAPPTSPETMTWAVDEARKKLKYVYAGNIAVPDGSDTICPGCGTPLIRRNGYRTDIKGLTTAGSCAACGRPAEIITT
ncbi:MAG: AmmeMemoRadiSam system radical SAM enzyme [Candidatus Hydrogenedentes bacterium]|nr:AmmeMemoRadiSam system radical SAM enzyme [Candidatus Hydrogenedentota bacterium]